MDINTFGATDTIENPFTYTSREWEPEVKLYYYRARFYDPELGRFISKDPLGLEAGDYNLYRYVWNSSTNYSDPLGLRPLTKDEIAMLTTVYYSNVDYSLIDINEGGIIAIGGYARTLGNGIHFPKDGYLEDFSKGNVYDQAWLVHEVGHIWQHQKLKDYSALKALGEHIKYKNNVYDYDANCSKKLTDYRYEQQAKILQDMYVLMNRTNISVADKSTLSCLTIIVRKNIKNSKLKNSK